MAVVICLLRGVNVVGRHKIRMEEWRGMLQELGVQGVRTHLQSGNAVMRVRSMKGLAEKIEAQIEERLGFRPKAILRTQEEIREVVRKNPFAGRGLPGDRVAVVFFADETDAVTPVRETDPEEVHRLGREHFIYFVNGIGKSKLRMNKHGTARNWNTVEALLRLAEEVAKARG